MLVSHGSAFATCARKAFATLEEQKFCLFDRFCLRGCCFFSFKHPSLFLTIASVPVRRFHRSTPSKEFLTTSLGTVICISQGSEHKHYLS